MDNTKYAMAYKEWSAISTLIEWLKDDDAVAYYHSKLMHVTIIKHVCGRWLLCISLRGEKEAVSSHFNTPEEVLSTMPFDEKKFMVTHKIAYLLLLMQDEI